MNFGRQRENSDDQPKMKKVNIEAWFTPQIPVATGPAKHSGLPGLILEVSDERTTMLCTKIVMNPKDKLKIKMPKQLIFKKYSKELFREKYDLIVIALSLLGIDFIGRELKKYKVKSPILILTKGLKYEKRSKKVLTLSQQLLKRNNKLNISVLKRTLLG